MFSRWLVFAVALTLLCQKSRANDPKPPTSREQITGQDKNELDLARLQGTWRIIDVEFGGDSVPGFESEKHDVVISGTTYVYRKPEQDPRKSRLRIDATKNPAEIDVTGVEGRFTGTTSRGIYLIKGDCLKICFGTGGKRPAQLKTSIKSLDTLIVLKRIKK